MTSTKSFQRTGLRGQLEKLRHLAQPFFLPLEQAQGWQFIGLLIALLFCVGGLVLLGILFGVCRQRKTLEKIDPNMQQDGVVAGQVVPGAGQPMLQQEV